MNNLVFNTSTDIQNDRREMKRMLFIDSRDGYTPSGTHNPFDFTVYLEDKSFHRGVGIQPYRNIVKMELKQVCIPKMNNNEHYVVVDIPEINDFIDSTDEGSHRSSAIVYYDSSTQVADKTIPAQSENVNFTFNPGITVLPQMTLKLKKYGGDILSLADFVTTNIDDLTTSFLFEITYVPK